MAIELESTTASDVCLVYVSDGGAYEESVYDDLRKLLEESSNRRRLKTTIHDNNTNNNNNRHTKNHSYAAASSIDLVVIGLDESSSLSAPEGGETSNNNNGSRYFGSGSGHFSNHFNNNTNDPSLVVSFADSCRRLVLATRSRSSVYLDADAENPSEAFDRASASINEGTSFAGNRLQRALTMQKF